MTYPEMNAEIVEILRSFSDPSIHYAASRIEELEAQLDQAVKALINLCAVIARLDIWEEEIDILDTRLTKEYNEARVAIDAGGGYPAARATEDNND